VLRPENLCGYSLRLTQVAGRDVGRIPVTPIRRRGYVISLLVRCSGAVVARLTITVQRFSMTRIREAGRTQVIGAIAAQQPAAILEVSFYNLITGRSVSLVDICFVAPRASGSKTVLGRGATATGNLRLELTYGAWHCACPMTIVRSSLRPELRQFTGNFRITDGVTAQASNGFVTDFQGATMKHVAEAEIAIVAAIHTL
jgi:hypothetical protein